MQTKNLTSFVMLLLLAPGLLALGMFAIGCDRPAADSPAGKTVESFVSTVAGGSGEGPNQQAAHPVATSNFARDREVFHFLLSNHDKIKREVTELENGVETLTESTDPKIAKKIQEHVAAMYQRVEYVRPIRMRDPLYREIFRNADKIEMTLKKTDQGIRVTETSKDEYVVKLIQAHAKVVSGFANRGFEEARLNHNPPRK